MPPGVVGCVCGSASDEMSEGSVEAEAVVKNCLNEMGGCVECIVVEWDGFDVSALLCGNLRCIGLRWVTSWTRSACVIVPKMRCLTSAMMCVVASGR